MNLAGFGTVDKNTKVRTIAIFLAVVLGVSVLAYSYGANSSAYTSASTVAVYNKNSGLAPYTYMIFSDGTNTYARNGTSGAITYSGSDAATVINSALSDINTLGGGSIYVKGYGPSQPYNIKSALIIPDSGHLKFVGDGPEYTVLQVPSGFDNNVFEFKGTKVQNSFFNEFRDIELIGNKGTGGVNNSGFFINGTGGFALTDSVWFNVFLRDFAKDDVYLGSGNAWNNQFTSVTFEHAGRAGLYRDGGLGTPDLRVMDSKFLYNDGYGVYDTGTFGTYIGNWFYRNNQYAMWTTDTFSKNVIEGNRFQNSGYGSNNAYDDLHMFQSDYNVVTGNFFYGSDNAVNFVRYGIYVDSFATLNLISNNEFGNGNFGTAKVGLGTSTQSSILQGNANWNPYGSVASPFLTTQNIIIPLGGNAAAPAASTDYIVRTTPIIMNSTGGTGVSITIKDASGTTVTSGATTLNYAYIPVGYKVNFGAFSVAPTVKIGFN